MPTVTIQRSLDLDDVAEALRQQLGGSYQVITDVSGGRETLRVKRSILAQAKVRLNQGGSTTTIHIQGSGVASRRLVNELRIAKKVAGAIEEAFSTAPPSGT